ncbi:cell wall hydrolase [Sneathiella marina]|uniref:Cell wall hydrolase n=1 Tax=Sneathiella marina TaxID=2950108 RepID=A0ABY4W075_9PROT|nr:cell wall hydrolase [Sneathiella marina]USG60352.1 cell wall hydrolase [Sneathiella marina]
MAKARSHEIGVALGSATILTIMVISFGLLFRIGAAADSTEKFAFVKSQKTAQSAILDQKVKDLQAKPDTYAQLTDLDMPDAHSLNKTYKSVDLFGRTFTSEDMCIAQAVYFEARSEPLVGQVAIAEVILNRIVDERYPDTACAVVFQNKHRRHKCQFSFACDGQSDRPRNTRSWEKALKVVALVMKGERSGIAKRATHYHASYVNPRWSAHLNKLGQVGSHIFYREEVI